MARNQSADVEFVRAIESAVRFRHFLPQQPISTDHGRRAPQPPDLRRMIDDQQMIAQRIESIDVAPRKLRRRICNRAAFLVENPIAQLLRLPNLGGFLRKPHFERAEPIECLGMLAPPFMDSPAAIGPQRRQQPGNAAKLPTIEQTPGSVV